jgi:sulfotransferase famil protein
MTVHLIHIGKTGGTAIKRSCRKFKLADWDGRKEPLAPETPYGKIRLHGHWFKFRDLEPEDHAFFSLRDPVDRFVSAYFSRRNEGRPRYYFPWTENERRVFEAFPTPESLAGALAGRGERRELAEWAMRHTRHMGFQTHFVGRSYHVRHRLDRVLYIARQETLAQDWENLKAILQLPPEAHLPKSPKYGHRRKPELTAEFSRRELHALYDWYDRDYVLVDYCEQIRVDRGWATPSKDLGRLRRQVRRRVRSLPRQLAAPIRATADS